MEPAAGAFMDTRDSRPLQDGIKDLHVSPLHPMTVPNCLPRRALVVTHSCYGTLEIVGAITILLVE